MVSLSSWSSHLMKMIRHYNFTFILSFQFLSADYATSRRRTRWTTCCRTCLCCVPATRTPRPSTSTSSPRCWRTRSSTASTSRRAASCCRTRWSTRQSPATSGRSSHCGWRIWKTGAATASTSTRYASSSNSRASPPHPPNRLQKHPYKISPPPTSRPQTRSGATTIKALVTLTMATVRA